ncbi:MAG: dihydroneopterin aldolase [Muribaculaceae bacterium]|nr:dihydroneopterin aldolase [Muribaculaceae bacterium]
MRIFAYHGVMPQENRVGNEYRVNCSVSYITSGENNDNIDNTISYADLHAVIEKEMKIPSKLLETVCHRIASSVRELWPHITDGEIEIEKTTPPIAGVTGSVYVRLEF